MGWKTWVPAINLVSVDGTTGKHTVLPTLQSWRSSNEVQDAAGPPPSVPTVYAPNELPVSGTGPYLNKDCTGAGALDQGLIGGFNVAKILPGPAEFGYKGWSLTFSWPATFPHNTTAWLNSLASYEVLGAAIADGGTGPQELDELDTTYTFEFYGTDAAFEPDGVGGWNTGAAGEVTVTQRISSRSEPATCLVTYKTGPGPMVFPELRPRWYGANSLDFLFPVNINTVESTAKIYLRYVRGKVDSVPSTYDGQVEVALSAKGTAPEYYTSTLTGLEPDTEYTVWIYAERDTNGSTSGTGPVSHVRTEATDTYTISDLRVSVNAAPRAASFRYSGTASLVQRATVLYVPRTWIETIKASDYAASGWSDTTKIRRSAYLGPFYPQDTAVVQGGAYVSEDVAPGYNPGAKSTATVEFGGVVEVVDLTQSTDYRYRVVVEQPSGTTYPKEGTFATPDFNRQRRSPRFTLGAY